MRAGGETHKSGHGQQTLAVHPQCGSQGSTVCTHAAARSRHAIKHRDHAHAACLQALLKCPRLRTRSESTVPSPPHLQVHERVEVGTAVEPQALFDAANLCREGAAGQGALAVVGARRGCAPTARNACACRLQCSGHGVGCNPLSRGQAKARQ